MIFLTLNLFRLLADNSQYKASWRKAYIYKEFSMTSDADKQQEKIGQAPAQEGQDETDALAKNPLLKKIYTMLTSSAPESWRIGGLDLTPAVRLPAAVGHYEQIIVRDIPQGSLALHFTQPIACNYLPGGYQPTPIAPATYSIQIRDRIFDANKAVDPRHAAINKGKRCEVIASGEVAKELFLRIREVARTFSENRLRDFQEKAQRLAYNLLAKIDDSDYSLWQKHKVDSGEEESIRFSAEIDALKVDVTRSSSEWRVEYTVRISTDKFEFSQLDPNVSKTAWEMLIRKDETSQLVRLESTLLSLGLDQQIDSSEDPEKEKDS